MARTRNPSRPTVMLLGPNGQLGRAIRAEATEGLDLVALPRGALDLRDATAIRRAVDEWRPDLILNAAAYTDIDAAEGNRELALAVNARAVETLARCAKATGAAFLHISTDQVFDGGLGRPYRETDHAAPLNIYGATKLLGEELAQLACPRTAILRTSCLHSASGKSMVRSAIDAVATGAEILAAADRIVSPTSAVALARICLKIAAQLIEADAYADYWGVTHCAALGECSEADLLREAVALAGQDPGKIKGVQSTDWPNAAARPRATPLDCARLTRVFAIQPPTWQSQLALTVPSAMPKHAPEAA